MSLVIRTLLVFMLVFSSGMPACESYQPLESPGDASVPDPLPPPVVISATPSKGPATGGTLVTVHGRNIQHGADLFFDGKIASSIEVLDDQHVRGNAPSRTGCIGVVDIEIVNPDGQRGSGKGLYRYFYDELLFTETPIIQLDHPKAETAAIGDLTGDGILDLVVAHDHYGEDDPNLMCIMEGLGNGMFSNETCFSIGSGQLVITDIVTGDFTGDGMIDVAIANGRTEEILIMKQEDSGAFSEAFRFELAERQSPYRMKAGDLDLDGDLDLVVAANHYVEFTIDYCWILVGINRGGGFLEFTELPVPEPLAIYSLALGDYNCDGVTDLAHSNVGEVFIWIGNGDGSFEMQDRFQISPSFDNLVYSLALADYDGDGIQDLYAVVADTIFFTGRDEFQFGELVVMKGDGEGSFAITTRRSLGMLPRDIVVSFLDEDSVPDVAINEMDDSMISVFRGEGEYIVTQVGSYSVDQYPATRLLSGDIDSDGLDDLLALNRQYNEPNSTISKLLNRGDLNFVGQKAYWSGYSPAGVVASDFTADGKVDLAVLNARDEEVKVLVGDGRGGFSDGQVYELDSAAISMTGIALDQDPERELLLFSPELGTFTVLDNISPGRFKLLSQTRINAYPRNIATGDWNGDGYLDLVILEERPGCIQIVLGGPEGTFTPWWFYDLGYVNSMCLAAGDIDGDGLLDLAVGKFNDRGYVVLFKGLGNGQFEPINELVGQGSTLSCALGDYNGDGHTDLLVSRSIYDEDRRSLGQVEFFRGDGSGEFGQGKIVTVDDDIYRYLLKPLQVDVDGDGLLDVLSTASDGMVSVLRVDEDTNEFRTPLLFRTGGYSFNIDAADFDGDGDLDIAAVGDHIQVRILMNGLGTCAE